MNLLLRFFRSFIPVTKWIRNAASIACKTNIIDRPSVHAYRCDPLGRCCRAQPQSHLDPFKNFLDVPAKAFGGTDRSIGKSMDYFDSRNALLPVEQGYPATLRTQVDRGERFPVCWRLHRVFRSRLAYPISHWHKPLDIYLRNASVNPPSTGIRCPVVQRDCGPARNRIAAAQSTGSIGWPVSVLFA